nr:MAG TPA: hypothetical protein [Caudoviricetes sp.]
MTTIEKLVELIYGYAKENEKLKEKEQSLLGMIKKAQEDRRFAQSEQNRLQRLIDEYEDTIEQNEETITMLMAQIEALKTK